MHEFMPFSVICHCRNGEMTHARHQFIVSSRVSIPNNVNILEIKLASERWFEVCHFHSRWSILQRQTIKKKMRMEEKRLFIKTIEDVCHLKYIHKQLRHLDCQKSTWTDSKKHRRITKLKTGNNRLTTQFFSFPNKLIVFLSLNE